MARQRGRGEVRNKKIHEGLQKIHSSRHDGWGGLFTAEYFKQLNSGLDTYAPVHLNVEAFDVHESEKFSANASGETVNRSCTQDDAQMIVDFLESSAVDDDDGGVEMVKEDLTFTPCLNDSLSDLSFENQEFGRDTNRLDYFSVAAFDVYENDHLTEVDSYGGGGGRRDRGIVLAPRPEQERGSATDVAGEAVVQRLEQERGDGGDSGGRRGRRLMVGTRLEQERGSATAGAGGGDRTREVPAGIFANNGSDGGEMIVKRLKQEGATVAVPVVVVQAVALMMILMVIMMVSVMVKKKVWW